MFRLIKPSICQFAVYVWQNGNMTICLNKVLIFNYLNVFSE